jgi:hypothetical protein
MTTKTTKKHQKKAKKGPRKGPEMMMHLKVKIRGQVTLASNQLKPKEKT